MSRSTSLAFALALALGACSGSKSDIAAPPDQTERATPPEKPDGETEERFVFETYPDKTVVQRGGFGKAPGGEVIASDSEKRVAIADLHATGPVVVLFYRGHW